MSDHTIRVLRPSELREASTLFRRALHAPPPTDEEWATTQKAFQPDRTLGVFDDEMIGTARSFDTQLTLPGGNRVGAAGVTGIGVRADRTRRGVLSSMIRAQFDDFLARGLTAAQLYATESAIYGRFGYGISTRARGYTIDRVRAVFRENAPAGGRVEMIDLDTAFRRLPSVYDAIASDRPGRLARPGHWWDPFEGRMRRQTVPPFVVLHHGPDGVDGYAVYTVERDVQADRTTMRLDELEYANPSAFAGLWRFLLDVDLVTHIQAEGRPLSTAEPTELLFTDQRVCSVSVVHEQGWLRVLDVQGALRARRRGGAPFTLAVIDPVLPDNDATFRITPDSVDRTTDTADAKLRVDVLAPLLLGDRTATALAAVGAVEEARPGAAAAFDDVLGHGPAPWCGTFF